jgi:hypothetical protein
VRPPFEDRFAKNFFFRTKVEAEPLKAAAATNRGFEDKTSRRDCVDMSTVETSFVTNDNVAIADVQIDQVCFVQLCNSTFS